MNKALEKQYYQLAQRYRASEQLQSGFVLIKDGNAYGWKEALDNPEALGTLAVSEDNQIFIVVEDEFRTFAWTVWNGD